MIRLPPQLTPSELLCDEDLLPFVREQLEICRSSRMKGSLSEALRRALDALEACQKMGARVGLEASARASESVTLIHLADVYREMDKLGPALEVCQKAYAVFQRRASRCQRHNKAVAAYALGLVHHLLGNEMDAMDWYREAGESFKRARDDWAAVRALARVESCDRLRRWIETLSDYLATARTAEVGVGTRVWLPIIPSDGDEGGFAIAELEIHKYVIGLETVVNGQRFRVRPLKGNRISLVTGVEYYVREIPDAVRGTLGAGAEDYVLVVREQDASREGPAVLETLGGPEFGNFERDSAGQIVFARPGAAAIVIGSEDIGEDLRVGYITALLKPI